MAAGVPGGAKEPWAVAEAAAREPTIATAKTFGYFLVLWIFWWFLWFWFRSEVEEHGGAKNTTPKKVSIQSRLKSEFWFLLNSRKRKRKRKTRFLKHREMNSS